MKKLLLFYFCFLIISNLFSQMTIEQSLVNKGLFLDSKLKDNNTNFISCGLYKSLTENPLYIIDGVPAKFEKLKQLDSCDIVSIELLKESASGIFSCRTIRDVILITTKQSTLRDMQIIDELTRVGIPGATITFKKRGTLLMAESFASEKGTFSYKIKEPNIDSISFSSIGYITRTFTVDELKKNKFIVVLKKNAIDLHEITIAGYVISCRKLYGGQCKISNCKRERKKSIETGKIKNNYLVTESASIKAFPNPALSGGTLQLNFNNINSGTYQIRLLNSSGQLFYSFQKQITSPKETEQIHLNEKMSVGIYLLQVIDDKKRLVQTSKVIVQ